MQQEEGGGVRDAEGHRVVLYCAFLMMGVVHNMVAGRRALEFSVLSGCMAACVRWDSCMFFPFLKLSIGIKSCFRMLHGL